MPRRRILPQKAFADVYGTDALKVHRIRLYDFRCGSEEEQDKFGTKFALFYPRQLATATSLHMANRGAGIDREELIHEVRLETGECCRN